MLFLSRQGRRSRRSGKAEGGSSVVRTFELGGNALKWHILLNKQHAPLRHSSRMLKHSHWAAMRAVWPRSRRFASCFLLPSIPYRCCWDF